MKYLLKRAIFSIFLIGCVKSFGLTNCSLNVLRELPNRVLGCYLAESEVSTNPQLLEKQYDTYTGVTTETYIFQSQIWPKSWLSAHSHAWQHRLIIYRPKHIEHKEAFLFVNGGTRKLNGDDSPPSGLILDFKRLAAETHSVVVNLQDVPNQYVLLDDGSARKEDNLVAYTWNRYLDDPAHNAYWPVHLAMTKSVIKAMDVTQTLIKQQTSSSIEYFIIAGASKRGWATWLAGIYDTRVRAIIPIVMDAPDTYALIHAIQNAYDGHWPIAFHDYVEEHTVDKIDTPEFAKLMQVLDPLAQPVEAAKRLRIPKYIIRASGDDFSIPDALNAYYAKLPGEKLIRNFPNQRHYMSPQVLESAIFTYYRMFITHEPRPSLSWKLNAAGVVTEIMTDQKPISVKLWEAENPHARDFRLASGITYKEKVLYGQCRKNRYCKYVVNITSPHAGWKASFIEATFSTQQGKEFVLTTPITVTSSSVNAL